MESIKEGAYRIALQEWVKISMFKRFISWVAYGLVRLLLGTIGHSDEK
jgi:cardiolipin synthase